MRTVAQPSDYLGLSAWHPSSLFKLSPPARLAGGASIEGSMNLFLRTNRRGTTDSPGQRSLFCSGRPRHPRRGRAMWGGSSGATIPKRGPACPAYGTERTDRQGCRGCRRCRGYDTFQCSMQRRSMQRRDLDLGAVVCECSEQPRWATWPLDSAATAGCWVPWSGRRWPGHARTLQRGGPVSQERHRR